MNEYVDRIMSNRVKDMLTGDGVCVPDKPEEMNWRLFFAHSQDMMGFRADIFTGGPNEEDNPSYQGYQGLRDRWTDSRTMMDGLARLWENSEGQAKLRYYSNPFRPKEHRKLGVRPSMDLLCGPSGNEATRTFAEGLEELRGWKVAHKSNAMIRAYAQNSSLLRKHSFSFRDYLMSVHLLPARDGDIEVAEGSWVRSIERDFYFVGPAISNYMVCDWLLWLWREGRIDWFGSYKPDSVHLRVVEKGLMPEEAREFKPYCRGLTMRPEWIPDGYANLVGKPVPPRILNEAIWLEKNQSSR